MDSFILWTPVHNREKEIKNLCTLFCVAAHSRVNISMREGAGIGEVRQLLHVLRFAHDYTGHRLVVIEDLDHASIPAQNALLKLLEEPPKQTILVVTCENIHALLETILSRCKVIKVHVENSQVNDRTGLDVLNQILTASIGQRLVLASKVATSSEKAIAYLDALSQELYTQLHQDKRSFSLNQITRMLTRVQKARQYIAANVNAKAVVDILLLGLPYKDLRAKSAS